MNASKRIQWLHKYIVEMRYPNAGRLAERFGISHRQAQRDVDALRRDFGAPMAYSAAHRGFYYTSPFTLPSYTVDVHELSYVDAISGSTAEMAQEEVLQMQIPYSAVLRIPNKLTCLELRKFIAEEQGKNCYLCEFHNVDVFLGLVLCAETDITVLEPDWLRERLVEAARRVLKNNDFQNERE